MDPIINLVKRPLIPGGMANSATSAWVNDAGTPRRTGGQDRWGNPLKGLDLDNKEANALIEVPEGYGLAPLQPGDELDLWLDGDGGTTAGLYRDRESEPDNQATVEPTDGTAVGATLTVPGGEGELWLKLIGGVGGYASRVRLSPSGTGLDLGIFDGTAEDTETTEYHWTGDIELSPSLAAPAGWEPPPTPTPPGAPQEGVYARIARRVQRYLESDTDLATIMEHAEVVTAYAYGYTRGRGFHVTGLDMVPYPDIENVIVAATGRLTPNPEQLSYYQTGDYSERPAVLAGWTLLERAVLNNYRRRWA